MMRTSACSIALLIAVSTGCSNDDSGKAASETDRTVKSGATSSSSEKPSTSSTPNPDTANPAYAKQGPYTVGVTTLTLGDRKVEVWYPANAAAADGKTKDTYAIKSWLTPALANILPADANPLFETNAYRDITTSKDGPFPLVLFRHGYAGYRDQSTFLTTHLASWGMVVASPDQREVGLEFLGGVMGKPDVERDPQEVMRSTVDLVRSENDSATSVLFGVVKAGKIGVTGHSLGGFASSVFANQPDVAVYVPIAAGVGNDGDSEAATAVAAKVPSLFMFGSIDTVVLPETTRAGFHQAAEP
ncbi:MAG: dienelactone hydrolase family protein, partial [Acidimicrobiia bacterium]